MVNLTTGSGRDSIDPKKLKPMLQAGTVIIDDRRRRPQYFDGRFLTAADLTRDQNYFLTRQADLCKAGGFGVVDGLLVRIIPEKASSIEILPGHGITPTGELVILPGNEPYPIDLTDIAKMQRLDAAFGLSSIPNEPARTASGLFVLALRPVEYTADPIAVYPTSIEGQRTVTDGYIIEAAAVMLIPYPDTGTPEMLRARVAREIFVEGTIKGIPADALPLAAIALSRGMIQWVDPFLVRREVGAEHGSILGLGFAPRALREAHVQQYHQHLQDVLESRKKGNRGWRFSASEHFLTLPAAGQMPADAIAIDSNNSTQIYFPPTVDVDLAFIPTDEVAALLEESLLLPPIDLTLSGEDLDSTSVLVLIPVQRQRVRQLKITLPSLTRQLLPAAPGMLAKRQPLEMLQGLKPIKLKLPTLNMQNLADKPWQDELAKTEMLWYVRRRNLSYRADISGFNIRLSNNDSENETELNKVLNLRGLLSPVNNLRSISTAAANARIVALLSSPKLTVSPTLLRGAIQELTAAKTAIEPTSSTAPAEEKLDQVAVFQVEERFGDPKLGEGILRLEAVNPKMKDEAIATILANSGKVPELDRLGRVLPEAELLNFTQQLVDLAPAEGATAVSKFIDDIKNLQDIGR